MREGPARPVPSLLWGVVPSLLGWVLMAGGVGYVANALLGYAVPDPGPVVAALVVPATVGELWMVGYLCVRGARREPAFH